MQVEYDCKNSIFFQQIINRILKIFKKNKTAIGSNNQQSINQTNKPIDCLISATSLPTNAKEAGNAGRQAPRGEAQ